jgi:hypothetical protein
MGREVNHPLLCALMARYTVNFTPILNPLNLQISSKSRWPTPLVVTYRMEYKLNDLLQVSPPSCHSVPIMCKYI